MSEFVRFPHTPHLAWLGEGAPRQDKVLTADEARALLAQPVVVEEKIDGANLGFSVSPDGELRMQNRGDYLRAEHLPPQFRTLSGWLAPRAVRLADALWPDLMLFGEWCYAVHSVRYDRLPDWFVGFDVYDRAAGRFWSADRRNALLAALGLASVPEIGRGRFTVEALVAKLAHSAFGDVPAEGLYVRVEDAEWLRDRAKLVRAEFVQAIDEHWSRRALESNRLRA